eukprot:TRINITY_DN2364_c0_g1_i1.p1 TRINITY_DN2364_c0_g1~~TRINITY_DN2364_c0_g1_i1.p1  ORF type:complete len:140 (+),score=23.51 TRINITY_DN2364_c0_g1_i1:136-555(+)
MPSGVINRKKGRFDTKKFDDLTEKDIEFAQNMVNPGTRYVQLKIMALVALLLVGSAFCYMKAPLLEAAVQSSWDDYDAHCVEHVDRDTSACANHLIHIRTDETVVQALYTGFYGCAALSSVGLFLLVTRSKEELESKIL